MAAKRPKIIITGANGFVGAELVRHFSNRGWQVVGLVRNAKKYRSKDVEYIDYDLAGPLEQSVFKDADYLVHTAYIKQSRRSPNAFELNVQSAKNLLAASRRHGLKKNVFMSSMSAHSGALSTYGLQKLAVEKIFNGKNDLNLRSGLIVGNGGIVKSMGDFMKSKHIVPLIDGGQQPLQVIGVKDLAMVIDQALTGNSHGTFTVANPRIYTYKEFYKQLAKHLKTKVLFVPIPFYGLLYLIRLINLLHLPLSVNEDNLWGLKQLRSFDTQKDLDKIGVQLRSLEELLG